MTKVVVQTGGKLYLAGEYSVLWPGQKAILVPIPILMTAEMVTSDTIRLFSDMFDYSVGMEADPNYRIIQETISTFSKLLGKSLEELPAFQLTITGKMESEGKKYGIGSSGSVTVLTLKALADFYHISLSQDLLFKLAAYTLLTLDDNGSMGDIACIAYNDLICFQSFDRQKVQNMISVLSFEDVLKNDWGYHIEVIKPKLDLTFLVGWTKIPSISKEMINKVKKNITSDFLETTQLAVIECQKALEEGDKYLFTLAIARISDLLQQLHPAIYHPKLLQLKEVATGKNAIAKSSGSGGGDCGIAFCFDHQSKDSILQEWKTQNIDLIYQTQWRAL